MKTTDLYPGERIDDLELSHLSIIQDPARFCFGMDAVLLSGFARIESGAEVIDLGTGNGILPILLSAKTEAKHITGLEIQEGSVNLARRSVEMNELTDRIRIVEGDLRDASKLFGKASFDVVVTNPPYMAAGKGLSNPRDEKAIARHEILCDLSDVIREAAALLKEGGSFFMVHRPFRLAEIITVMHEKGIEPKRLRMVYPFADKEPNLLLIEGRRGGKPFLTVEKPLIIYSKPDVYTDELREKYGY